MHPRPASSTVKKFQTPPVHQNVPRLAESGASEANDPTSLDSSELLLDAGAADDVLLDGGAELGLELLLEMPPDDEDVSSKLWLVDKLVCGALGGLSVDADADVDSEGTEGTEDVDSSEAEDVDEISTLELELETDEADDDDGGAGGIGGSGITPMMRSMISSIASFGNGNFIGMAGCTTSSPNPSPSSARLARTAIGKMSSEKRDIKYRPCCDVSRGTTNPNDCGHLCVLRRLVCLHQSAERTVP